MSTKTAITAVREQLNFYHLSDRGTDRTIAELVFNDDEVFAVVRDAVDAEIDSEAQRYISNPENGFGLELLPAGKGGVGQAIARRLAETLTHALRRCRELQTALDAEREAHKRDVELVNSARATLRNDLFSKRVSNALADLDEVDNWG